MNFEKNIERLKREHKISVREAIDLQNMHTSATEALRNITRRKEDIRHGHMVKMSRSPKEELKFLDGEAATYKTRLSELTSIVRDAKKRVVLNYY